MFTLRGIAALGGAAALVLTGITAGTASASTSLFHTTVVSPEHPDTTSVGGSATQSTPGGPVWADDHLKIAITVSSAGSPGHYNVVMHFGGSTFEGFADPGAGSDSANYGGPLFSQGKITGSITYDDISSSTAPVTVPSPTAPDTSLDSILSQLFSGHNSAPASVHYSFTYTPTIDAVDVTGSGDTWTPSMPYTQVG